MKSAAMATVIWVLAYISAEPVALVMQDQGEELRVVVQPEAVQHIKDPAKCTEWCVPPGYDGERPDDVNPEAERKECNGACARAQREGGDDPEHECKPSHTCDVWCSEVCCQCLRECV